MRSLLSRCWRWLVAQVPTDEGLAALPENDAQIRARMQDLEVCRRVALDALAARNTTVSHLRRGA
jgi:hypothetical protein